MNTASKFGSFVIKNRKFKPKKTKKKNATFNMGVITSINPLKVPFRLYCGNICRYAG